MKFFATILAATALLTSTVSAVDNSCSAGTYDCAWSTFASGAILSSCVNGKWSKLQTCRATEMCDQGEGRCKCQINCFGKDHMAGADGVMDTAVESKAAIDFEG